MVLPVIKKLRKMNVVNCVVLGLTTAGETLRKHRIPFRGFESLVGSGDDQAIEYGKKLLEETPPNKAIDTTESISYLGLSYKELVDDYGKKGAQDAYRKYGRQAFLPLRTITRLFHEVEPDLLVTTISPRAEQAALMVAKKFNVPSLCLVDFFPKIAIKRAALPHSGTRVCVLSEGVRSLLIQEGRQPSEVVVTGNPAFDKLANLHFKGDGFKLRKRLGWAGKKIILWASQREPKKIPNMPGVGDPRLPEKIERALLNAVKRNSDWRLIIKFHPNESPRIYRPTGIHYIASPVDKLYSILSVCDAVVTINSTVGLEARFLECPLMTVELGLGSKDAGFVDNGLSYGIDKLKDIEGGLRHLLSIPRTFPSGFDRPGKATDKVLKQVFDLLGHGGPRPFDD